MLRKLLAVRPMTALRCLWPEILVALLAIAAFLGCLGSLDIWSEREQHASARAIETYTQNRWLDVDPSSRPSLGEPPLSRWSIAALMCVTGRRDEWILRLPNALAGLGTVALVYWLGCGMAGRSVGLAAAMVLCSLGFFVAELRLAGPDGLSVFFATLSLVSAWRCLSPRAVPAADAIGWSSTRSIDRTLVFPVAVGLAFLSGGPAIVALIGTTLVPFLLQAKLLSWGFARLSSVTGIGIVIVLAVSWALGWFPQAEDVSDLTHVPGASLATQWPAIVFPWSAFAIVASVIPIVMGVARWRTGAASQSGERTWPSNQWMESLWLSWWWGVGSLLLLSVSRTIRPSDYLPCLPGIALLVGLTWIWLAGEARQQSRRGSLARAVLQAHWVATFVAALAAPLVLRAWLPPDVWPWAIVIGFGLAAAAVASVVTWKRGGDAMTLGPLAAAVVVGSLIVYGWIAPVENPSRGHRALATRLPALLPDDVRRVVCYNQSDDGLRFYLSNIELVPLPRAAAALTALVLRESGNSRPLDQATGGRDGERSLREWLDSPESARQYLLARDRDYQQIADDLAGRVVRVYRETGRKGEALVLLRVIGPETPRDIATLPDTTRR